MDSYFSKYVEVKLSEIKLLRKAYIFLVFLTYVYHDARHRECKVYLYFVTTF